MLPYKLKNCTIHDNGYNFIGQLAETTLPTIAEKVEAWRGGGMLGEVDISVGLEKMEWEWSIGGLAVQIMRRFGIIGIGAQLLRFNGAYQEEGEGTVLAAELIARGKHVAIEPGNAKPGDDTMWKIKSSLSYLQWTVNGAEELAIDMINAVFRVGGVDRMAEIRAALDGGASLGISGGAGGISINANINI